MKLTTLAASATTTIGRAKIWRRQSASMVRAPAIAIQFARAMVCAAATLGGTSATLSNEIFRCVVVESRHVSEEGKQERYPRDIYAGEIIVADTRSGLVRLFGNPYQFVIAQTGSKENGWILTRRDPGLASTSVQLLAIQIYSKGIPFMMADGMHTYSGNCTEVR
jgi:hypothetical protein